MATLNLTQRRYILNELVTRHFKSLEQKYKSRGHALLRGNGYYLVKPKIRQVRVNGTRSTYEYEIEVGQGHLLDSKTCFNLDKTAESFGTGAELPDSWYFEQYKAGKYKLTAEMQKCYSRPKVSCDFTNEAKALKAAQAKARKDFKVAYKKQAETLSELRYDVLEFHNWLEDVAKPQIMLSKGDADLLSNLLKQANAL